MKNMECKVDALDLKILSIISKDARIPFRNVAELCGVSRAAIHLRVQHLIDMGIISGSSYEIDVRRLGYNTCTYIGIRLERGSMYKDVVERLREIPEVVEDNAATFHAYKPLDAAEEATLEQARIAFMDSLGVPCSGCRYCCDDCPEGLDIPLLIRYYNEKSLGGEAWKIPGLENTKSADHCLQCGTCTGHCPQKINIPQIMEKLQKKE